MKRLTTTEIITTATKTLAYMNALLDSPYYCFEARVFSGRMIWFKLIDIHTGRALHQYTLCLSTSVVSALTIIADYEEIRTYQDFDRADIIDAMLYCMVDCKLKEEAR